MGDLHEFIEKNREALASQLATGTRLQDLHRAVRALGHDVELEVFEVVCKQLGVEEMPLTIIKPSGRYRPGE